MNSKKPERTCMGCGEQKSKNEFLRIVRTKEGILEIDQTGKQNGRGAYICKNEACLNKMMKSKKLEKVFHIHLENSFYEKIRACILGKS